MRLVRTVRESWQEFMDDLRPLGLTRRARAIFAAFGVLVGMLAVLALLADIGLALFDVVAGTEQDTEAAVQIVIGPVAIISGTALVLGAALALVAGIDRLLRGVRWGVGRITG